MVTPSFYPFLIDVDRRPDIREEGGGKERNLRKEKEREKVIGHSPL